MFFFSDEKPTKITLFVFQTQASFQTYSATPPTPLFDSPIHGIKKDIIKPSPTLNHWPVKFRWCKT